jgi:4-amino-4-deoxy-L-arabinose transferase-like glycosyltransferase
VRPTRELFPPLLAGDLLAVAAIVTVTLVRLAPDLGHDTLWNYDESFHQVVTRHTFDHPLEPTLYDDPVHPKSADPFYWAARVWLAKPPGAFWIGALMMHLVGPDPLAFRLGALLAQVFAALTLYLFARAVTNRLWALLASLFSVCVPLAWTLTQGRFVGDVLDVELSGLICAAMILLLLGIQRQSLWLFALAGAVTGGGILVKSLLALTPLGVAGLLWLLSRARLCPGPPFKGVALMGGVMVAVAAPWHLYAATRWPDVYILGQKDLLTQLLKSHVAVHAPQWQRPVDAIFNEINSALFEPLPHAAILVIGMWLVVRAVRRRELIVVAAAAWLWANWIGHSFASVKVVHHLWGATVPGFIAVAVVLDDVWKSRPLSFAVAWGAAIPYFLSAFPALAKLRELAPERWMARSMPGLLEGLAIIIVGALLGWLATTVRRFPTWLAAALASSLLCWTYLWKGTTKQSDLAAAARKEFAIVYSRDVGRALDALTPKKSVLVFDKDFDHPGHIETHDLMFWSDRLVVPADAVNDYVQAGYRPYLVSAAAQPFAPITVPAHAWLRAYDASTPLQGPQPLPEGVRPLDLQVGTLKVLGFATGPGDGRHDRYAFYVRAEGGVPEALPVTFQTRDSKRKSARIEPEATLKHRERLGDAEWFVMPCVGPLADEVRAIELGSGQRISLEAT